MSVFSRTVAVSALAAALLISPLVVVGLFLGGCASEAGDAVGQDEGAVTAAGEAITLANYVTHPKIKAVRADVAAIDLANYKKDFNPGCDGNNTKWTDASGTIRKVFSDRGEAHGSGSTTAYYGANGKLRFLFFTVMDFSPNDGSIASFQGRVYFDDDGQPFWEVSRYATAPLGQPEPDMSKAPDTITPDDAKYVVDDGHENPQKWFEQRGCGEP